MPYRPVLMRIQLQVRRLLTATARRRLSMVSRRIRHGILAVVAAYVIIFALCRPLPASVLLACLPRVLA